MSRQNGLGTEDVYENFGMDVAAEKRTDGCRVGEK